MICRGVFVTLCVVPTLLVGAAALVVHTPVYARFRRASWESTLAARLGVGVTIARLDQVDGRRLILYRLRLTDPERGQDVAIIRSAELTREGTHWDVELNQCQVLAARLDWLTRRFHDHILETADLGMTLRVHAANLVLTGSEPVVCLADVTCQMHDDPGGREVLVAVRMPGQSDDEPIRLRVVRNRQLDPPATGWELHTGAASLPCVVVSRWLPGAMRLGPECMFGGSIWAERTMVGWNADLHGRLQDVDLDHLVTGSFPHKLSGMAQVQIADCSILRGRITEVKGRIEAAHGVISASLLNAAAKALQLQRRAASDVAMLVRYEKLALEFALDEKGLTVRGLADARGGILQDAAGALLSARDPQPLSPLALVRLLVPDSRLNVPATKETAQLVRVLPLPEIVPTDTTNARIPYASLRLHRR